MNTPDHILRTLRKRRGLDETDTSIDTALDQMEPMDKLRECVAWELGSRHWADRVLYLAKQCEAIDYD